MIDALFIACAGVALASALIATHASRKCAEQIATARSLCATLSAERGLIATHDIELDRVTDALRKLSGRIAAEKSRSNRSNGDETEAVGIDRLTWKAKMRDKYGITPTVRS
jgi:hypothetical protein